MEEWLVINRSTLPHNFITLRSASTRDYREIGLLYYGPEKLAYGEFIGVSTYLKRNKEE